MAQLLSERGYLSGFDCDLQFVNVYGAESPAPCWENKKVYTSLTPKLYTQVYIQFQPYGISTNSCFQMDYIHRNRGSQPERMIVDIVHMSSGGGNK
jgi:hypothetical protein